jgi:hypothetical protein
MLVRQTGVFLRANALVVILISVIVLLPCFWHRRIEAGDLASHTYNAWLAGLIKKQQAPGLYIQSSWNNILGDYALEKLGLLLGYIVAERIVVGISVLVFFWGAFALVSVANRRPPWSLVPALAMITYGWTFYSGFLNFYLSIGLAFFAVALFWRGQRADLLLGAVVATFALIAHPLGFLYLIGLSIYFRIGASLTGWRRWGLLGCAFLVVVGVSCYARHARTEEWHTTNFFMMNGADQLILFGKRYKTLAYLTALFCSFCFLHGVRRKETFGKVLSSSRSSLEMWTLFLFTAAAIPEVWWFPQYEMPFSFVISRTTTVTAVLGLSVLGSVTPRQWHLAGLTILAILFFAWTYGDTKALNIMEWQEESMIKALPYGRRVIETIDLPKSSHIASGQHILERACIGKCFEYSNYEPSSKAFRIRVTQGSPIVTDSAEDSMRMQGGSYIVRKEDLPMNQIYQCDSQNPLKLCIRELFAGEENGRLNVAVPVTE